MIDGRNFYDQSVTNQIGTYDNIKKIAAAQGDDYATGAFLIIHTSRKTTR